MTADGKSPSWLIESKKPFSTSTAPLVIEKDNLGALVSQSLSQDPNRTALRHAGRSLTRSDLQMASMRVMERLEAAELAKGELVLVEIAHSPELVVALCGILMAGGSPVPLDPTLSEERRQAIRDTVDTRVVLSYSADQDDIDLELRARPAQLAPGTAFLVYTSGSSGKPKAVEIPHEGYAQRLRHIVGGKSPNSTDVDLIWTPSSFIGFLDEVFYPLLSRVPTVIASDTERSDPNAFANLIAREGVTAFRITPSLLDVFLTPSTAERLNDVRLIYCSGEAVSAAVQQKVYSLLNATLIGFYGASEAPGIGIHVFDRDAPPLSNTVFHPQVFSELRVVNENGDAASPKETGEIWVAGCAVARGYWGKPDLTSKRFVRYGGLRWYKTGDLGRHLEDGSVELLGRSDLREVKINGVRVDLSEVRAALRSLNTVHDAWVSPVKIAEDNGPTLVGHLVGVSPMPTASSVRRMLASRLPSAAMPSFVIHHDRFPLADNGKLDVQTLAQNARKVATTQGEPSPHRSSAAAHKSQSALKRTVGRLWSDVLFIGEIGDDQNFFDLGGDSLRAIRLLMEIEEVFDVTLSNDSVFGPASTVSGMANMIEELRSKRGRYKPTNATPKPERAKKKRRRKPKRLVKDFLLRLARDKRFASETEIEMDEVRRRMGIWTRQWPGENVGIDLPIFRCSHETGKLPLFYCVNSVNQAEVITEILDQEVDLFLMRSLNRVIDDPTAKQKIVPGVVEKYKNEIVRNAPTGPLALAGNCQGGPIAEALAHSLMEDGREVVQLVLLEHEPSKPYPGRVSMFFMAESLYLNPFHQRPDPASEWREAHTDPTWDILPGDHGHTFTDESLSLYSRILIERIRNAATKESQRICMSPWAR